MDAAAGISNAGKKLQMLLFADNIAPVAEGPQSLQNLLNELTARTKTIGRTVKISKASWMNNAYGPRFAMNLDKDSVELVGSYTCLGQVVQMNNDLGTETARKIRTGWITFAKFREIFCDKKITSSAKSAVYNSTVLPAMLYGCES
ncbi:unnamed protein product [Gongylonema pulchrum]|uniref:Reverse transcriptase domain-containing protein n=1 Tax=Gongylonema pulchrum TaxID=637853 RepID=A0A183DYB5_9BILA|nr:unnamed protein product [Gongylonema pulchrum]